MNFTSDVKKELMKLPCGKEESRAALSAYFSACGVFAESGTGEPEFFLVSETERPVAEYDMKTILDAPVKAGDEVGVVRYRLGQEEIGQSHYCSEEEAAAWGLSYCLQRILDFWIF